MPDTCDLRDTGHHYKALKSRVVELKKQQQAIARNAQCLEQAESAELLEQRLHYEGSIKSLEEQMAGMQQQLKQTLDRSAKLRQHCERDKKAMQARVDTVTKTLESIESEHCRKTSELAQQHALQIQHLTERLEREKQQLVCDAAAAASAAAAQLADVEGWCSGEIEAVRHQCSQQLADAQAIAQEWRSKYEVEAKARRSAEAAAQAAEAAVSSLQQQVEALSAKLQASIQESSALRQQLVVQAEDGALALSTQARDNAATHEQQTRALKAQHAQQLELLNGRVQDVVRRKDAAIAALKAELAATCASLHQLQGL
ncbi:hypothetical protein QJQ45_028572 [Haematococcus lacustris]|nr:hypothetical protein QJQ45_028572 [Haematococcus lacustris]